MMNPLTRRVADSKAFVAAQKVLDFCASSGLHLIYPVILLAFSIYTQDVRSLVLLGIALLGYAGVLRERARSIKRFNTLVEQLRGVQAEQRHAMLQSRLAGKNKAPYQEHLDKERFDLAVPLLLDAIDGGEDSEAFRVLACLYYQGRGVPKSFDQAVTLMEKSARMGNANALAILGREYMEGGIVPKDLDKAQKLLLEAARQKHPHALRDLDMLLSGPAFQSPDNQPTVH